MKTTTTAWVSAAEAARLLGVTRATLYAYVSRGRIRSEAGAGPRRDRRYAREDVERLRRRAEERRDPDKVAAHALHWGMPVLESAITAIADGSLYYRGHDAIELARHASVESVAMLIWTGRVDGDVGSHVDVPRVNVSTKEGSFIARAQVALTRAAVADPLAFDVRPEHVVRTGWRIVNLLVRAAVPRAERAPIAAALSQGWQVRAGGEALIRASLILCADHELNVSAFTARCVASAGEHPYGVVVAALAALEGTKHGGSTVRVERLMTELRRERSIRKALTACVRETGRLEGVGHPLYPKGDPRAGALLGMIENRFPRSPEWRFVRELANTITSLTGERPNLDFALAAVSRVLGLPPESGLTLFAIGRSIGWIGHAMEQYAVDQIIRPRARYRGAAPGAGVSATPGE